MTPGEAARGHQAPALLFARLVRESEGGPRLRAGQTQRWALLGRLGGLRREPAQGRAATFQSLQSSRDQVCPCDWNAVCRLERPAGPRGLCAAEESSWPAYLPALPPPLPPRKDKGKLSDRLLLSYLSWFLFTSRAPRLAWGPNAPSQYTPLVQPLPTSRSVLSPVLTSALWKRQGRLHYMEPGTRDDSEDT